MANEVGISVSLTFDNGKKTEGVSVSDIVKSISGSAKVYAHLFQTIGITQEAILLGDVSAPGYALFVNLDDTNFVDLKVAMSGAIFARLDPDTDDDGHGGVALLKLGSGAQVPAAIADTAPCEIEIFLIAT